MGIIFVNIARLDGESCTTPVVVIIQRLQFHAQRLVDAKRLPHAEVKHDFLFEC
jgi:hypothetical protein